MSDRSVEAAIVEPSSIAARGSSAEATEPVAVPGFCALCKSRCGSLMLVQNGKLVGQEPDPGHPTGKSQCVKGRAAPEIVYNPQRLLRPLMRTRPKGEADPGWREISWDEALDRSAAALARIRDESGPEAVAFSIATPSGTPIADDIRWIERFANAFGSPNVVNGTEICNWHKDFTHAYTFGRGIATPDFENTRCIVLWGHNPGATWLHNASAIGEARARGARIVVVDPRKSGFAADADCWLRVRPGSDGALALGLSRAMIVNRWFDEAFVARFTNAPLLVCCDTGRFLRAGDLAAPPADGATGDLVALSATGALLAYDKTARNYRSNGNDPALQGEGVWISATGAPLRCRTVWSLFTEACAPYTPERVAEICWIGAHQVEATARLLHESAPALSYYCWAGVCQHTNATQTDRAIATLMALTGSFDAEGGNVAFPGLPVNDVSGKELLAPEQRAKCIGFEHSRLGPARHAWIGSDALYGAILDGAPYPIRGLIGFGRNFLLNHADADRGARALAALEFYVHADVTLTPTASLADIVLPINTPWEREALRTGFEGSEAAERWVQLRLAAIAPLGESRSDAAVAFELARRLGLGALFWEGDIDAGLEYILAPLNIRLADLRRAPRGFSVPGATRYRKYLQDGFNTDTGRIELYSEVFLSHGYEALPSFAEPAVSPVGQAGGEFPLVLTTSKIPNFRHSQDRQIPSLRRRTPDPEVHLHSAAAQVRDIREGDWVRIRSPHGEIRMRARFDDDLDPRVVWIEYGWWQHNQLLGLDGFDSRAATGANFSRLISDRFTDPVSGSSALRSYLCDIAPAIERPNDAWQGWRPFRIAAATLEARGVLSFRLEPQDGKVLPPFFGGQHVALRAGPDGEKWVRCYSLSSLADPQAYRLTVKLAGDGKMSNFLHALSPQFDAVVELTPPRGAFHIQPTAVGETFPVVLIAGGIGITPLLAMLYQLRRDGWPQSVQLLYSVRAAKDHAFAEEIRALQETMPSLRVTTFHTQPDPADREEAGRLSSASLAGVASVVQARYYVCGPAGMVAFVDDELRGAGVDASRIFTEAFGPASRKPSARTLVPQPVRLARSDKMLFWRPGGPSLLELAESSGVDVVSGCRVGQCESCTVKLLDGEVECPGQDKHAADECFLCVAVPLTPLSLDL